MSEDNFALMEVRGKIQQIQAALLQQDPLLPIHLGAIHKQLIKHEELVHLLSDEEITVLVAGQKKHANVQLVKEVAKSRTKIPKTTVDDL